MIQFSTVKDIEIFFDEFRHMAAIHHQEINLFGLQLGYSETFYKEIFEAKKYFLFQVRENDVLKGYAGFFVYNPTQHIDHIHAKQDILYLCPELRGIGAGTEFIKYCDECFTQMECSHVLHSVPASNDWSPLLERLGYHKLETIYSRSL